MNTRKNTSPETATPSQPDVQASQENAPSSFGHMGPTQKGKAGFFPKPPAPSSETANIKPSLKETQKTPRNLHV